MAAVTYIDAVLLFHLMVPITAIPCSDALTWKKSLSYKKLALPSVRKCAAECDATPVCASLNFDMETNSCILYSNRHVPANVFGNLELWTKPTCGIRHGIFSQVKLCGAQLNSIYTRDCGEPPDVVGSVKVIKHYPQGSLTTYTCRQDFIPCDRKSTQTSKCQTSGLWEKVSMRCERFHWSNINQGGVWDPLPCGPSRKLHFNLTGTHPKPSRLTIDVVNGKDILLHLRFNFTVPPNKTRIVVDTRIQQIWSSRSVLYSSWQVGQASQICITMNNGKYTVTLNGTTLVTRREPKTGVKASLLFISPSFKLHDLKIRRIG